MAPTVVPEHVDYNNINKIARQTDTTAVGHGGGVTVVVTIVAVKMCTCTGLLSF
jgi:hypothetical protein